MTQARLPLRIAIATLGRFHVLDLARELDALGHEVKFYSYVPRRRARQFGLPAHCHVAMLPFLIPFIALVRVCGRTRCAPDAQNLLQRAADRVLVWRLKPCDVFIGMSGIFVKAPLSARERFGARIIIERGSVHITLQKEILDRVKVFNKDANSVPAADVKRELCSYEMADRIVVPSHHAEKSFLDRGFPPSKLCRIPYGVDLGVCKPQPNISRDARLVLFVGTWSYQKGVDVLVKAMETLQTDGFRLVHVGPVGDAPVPTANWFEATGKLDQSALPPWYGRACCLVLPSRQDGFGLVLVQALACACPVIGSTMTGAIDLKDATGRTDMVQDVPLESEWHLIEAIRTSTGPKNASLTDTESLRAMLGWRPYALRYQSMLLDLMQVQASHPCNVS